MKSRTDRLVQAILVPRQGSHERLIQAVAIASRLAYLSAPQDPRWIQWEEHAPAKSVRRVKAPSHLEQARQWALDQRVPHVWHDGVLALVPMAYSQMPQRVRGSQVNGVDYPPEPGARMCGDARVTLLEGLTTGKAAAQAAHAVWAWASHHPTWNPRTGLDLQFTDETQLETVATAGGVPIRDGGFTEVQPGTLTAVVNSAPPQSR